MRYDHGRDDYQAIEKQLDEGFPEIRNKTMNGKKSCWELHPHDGNNIFFYQSHLLVVRFFADGHE